MTPKLHVAFHCGGMSISHIGNVSRGSNHIVGSTALEHHPRSLIFSLLIAQRLPFASSTFPISTANQDITTAFTTSALRRSVSSRLHIYSHHVQRVTCMGQQKDPHNLRSDCTVVQMKPICDAQQLRRCFGSLQECCANGNCRYAASYQAKLDTIIGFR